jgi:hypothetical protein
MLTRILFDKTRLWEEQRCRQLWEKRDESKSWDLDGHRNRLQNEFRNSTSLTVHGRNLKNLKWRGMRELSMVHRLEIASPCGNISYMPLAIEAVDINQVNLE